MLLRKQLHFRHWPLLLKIIWHHKPESDNPPKTSSGLNQKKTRMHNPHGQRNRRPPIPHGNQEKRLTVQLSSSPGFQFNQQVTGSEDQAEKSDNVNMIETATTSHTLLQLVTLPNLLTLGTKPGFTTLSTRPSPRRNPTLSQADRQPQTVRCSPNPLTSGS